MSGCFSIDDKKSSSIQISLMISDDIIRNTSPSYIVVEDSPPKSVNSYSSLEDEGLTCMRFACLNLERVSTNPVRNVSWSNAVVASVAAIWINVNTRPQRDSVKDKMIANAVRHVNDGDELKRKQ